MIGKKISTLVDKKTFTLFELASLALSFLGLVSLLLGLGSLFIIYRQTKEITRQSENSPASFQNAVYQTITTQEMEVDKLFVENPQLRPYFFSAHEINEGSSDYAKAEAIADYELDFFDSAKGRLRLLQEVGYDVSMNAWNKYFDDSFTNSPILCKRLRELTPWYGSDFVSREIDVCNKLQSQRLRHPAKN
jgi:hypothetical protein